jgi:site-specific recombinase XerD
MNTILQAVSPRTLQTYWTAWGSFKKFHRAHNMVFPEFSLLSISSFVTYLHHTTSIKPGSIKVYLSGIHFFFKLLHGQQCPNISNPQISLLIKGLQKTNPPRPDSRQPLTIDILSICLTTLRSGLFSPIKARTLDAMFNLAFFGFLRVSEFTINSNFNPSIHPTFSDLQIINSDTIRFNIKQSKTDQLKHGHSIFIFNLPTPIQPYQSLNFFLHQRKSQITSSLDPLFIDDDNLPASRHWFQRNLKSILNSSGIPTKQFSSHSFRIGAATTAAQRGLSDHQIKMLGRWSSHAFETYVRSDLHNIRQAQQALASF